MRDCPFSRIDTQADEKPGRVLVYKRGANYCSFNKSALWLIRQVKDFPFLIEYRNEGGQKLIRVTYSKQVFEAISKNCRVAFASNERPFWKLNTTHPPIDDYELKIWRSVMLLELECQR